MEVKYIAAATVTSLGVATICATAAAAATASTVATVAYSILALLGASSSVAAITAACSDKSTNTENYFNTLKEHLVYTIPGMVEVTSKVVVSALMDGIAAGIRDLFWSKLTGEKPRHSYSRY